MKPENQFFSIHHIEHFRNGLCSGIHTEGDTPRLQKTGGSAVFISRAFDAKKRNTGWHRALITLTKSEDTFVSFSFHAADTKHLLLADGTRCDVDALMDNPLLSAEEKIDILQNAGFWDNCCERAGDILLYPHNGRYLWVKMTVSGDMFPENLRIRLYYPRQSFVEYLPESYQTAPEDFFARFTALFQSLYLDLDEKIAAFPERLDSDTAPADDLVELAGWLGLQVFLPLETDKLRRLISAVPELYPVWGTKNALIRLIELLCGEKPYVREQGEANPFSFKVLLPDNPALDLCKVKTAIEAVKPAHTSYSLIPLKEALTLDSHTYLGINSRLSEYRPPCLDTRSALGIHRLGH